MHGLINESKPSLSLFCVIFGDILRTLLTTGQGRRGQLYTCSYMWSRETSCTVRHWIVNSLVTMEVNLKNKKLYFISMVALRACLQPGITYIIYPVINKVINVRCKLRMFNVIIFFI